mgnify:CR=1 FL=1
MIFVRVDPNSPSHQAFWKAWRKAAAAATVDYIEKRGRDPNAPFDPSVWIELRNWLRDNVFNDKCAYCESKLSVVGYGDAEHYRPKKKVTRGLASDNTTVQHSGYYWLAYTWQNILPACTRCNTKGKRNQFPIRAQRYVNIENANPTQLDSKEDPLLIHPSKRDPRKHLLFDKKGRVAPRTAGDPYAEATIRVLQLNREELRKAREDAWRAARRDLLFVLEAEDETAIEEFYARFAKGTEAYSAAVLDMLDGMLTRMGAVVAASG